MRQNMGRVATCFDNAACESFFATLKTELVHTRTWPTRQAARTAIYEYLKVFYNRRRRHRHSAWTISALPIREGAPPAAASYPHCRIAIPCLQNRVNPIVIVRLRWHQPTRDYLARRTAEGKTPKEIVRCLNRYVAREIFAVLRQTDQQTLITAA